MRPGPNGCVKIAVTENSQAAGFRRGGAQPRRSKACRPQHRTAAMKDQAALNRLRELRRGRHLVVGERDRHAPLRQLDRQRRRDRQPVFRDINQEQIARTFVCRCDRPRAQESPRAAAFAAARSNDCGRRSTIVSNSAISQPAASACTRMSFASATSSDARCSRARSQGLG